MLTKRGTPALSRLLGDRSGAEVRSCWKFPVDQAFSFNNAVFGLYGIYEGNALADPKLGHSNSLITSYTGWTIIAYYELRYVFNKERFWCDIE